MKTTINNGDSGLIVRTALNSMFTELYAAVYMPIKLPNVSVNTELVIPENTFVKSIFMTVVSGTPTVNIGTSGNSGNIIPTSLLTGFNQAIVDWPPQAQQTFYITISGGVVSFRFDVLPSFF